MTDVNTLRDWRFSVDREGIAWAVFDREGESQNSFSRRALEELGAIVERGRAGRARPAPSGASSSSPARRRASSSAPTCASSSSSPASAR